MTKGWAPKKAHPVKNDSIDELDYLPYIQLIATNNAITQETSKMKILFASAAALMLLASPAFAQKAISGSVSGAVSGSNLNYAPHSTYKGNGWHNAPGVVGAVSNSPYKCKDALALGTSIASVAFPVSDEDCGPIVAAMACKEMQMPPAVCQTTLMQNRYIRASVLAHQQAGVNGAYYQEAQPQVRYTNTRNRRGNIVRAKN